MCRFNPREAPKCLATAPLQTLVALVQQSRVARKYRAEGTRNKERVVCSTQFAEEQAYMDGANRPGFHGHLGFAPSALP